MAVMKDVAKLAGVSVSTVSFVLNGTAKEHKVADATAQKVLRAAKELGYKMNSPVQADVVKPWQPTIAFFMPMDSAWMDMTIITASIHKHIKKSGRNYNVLLCTYEENRLIEKIEQVDQTSYDAAVISVESESDLENLEKYPGNPPFVLYNNTSSRFSSVSCLADEAINRVVQMIAAKGYKEVTVLAGSDSWNNRDEYLKTFLECCAKYDIKVPEDCYIATESTLIGGAIGARQILNMTKKPEVIMCMNTALAFGAIPLLARNCFIIPKDAELFCFGSAGDAAHIANYIPALSMIALPIDEITMESFDLALRLAEDGRMTAVHYTCTSNLILHESFSL